MKFIGIIAAASSVVRSGLVKRDTDNTQASGLSYTNVLAGCQAHPDGFDEFMNNNKCSDGLLEGTFCSTGYATTLAYSKCTCEYDTTAVMVIPECTWEDYTPTEEELAQFFPPTVNPFLHTEESTVAAVNDACPAIDPPTNGYLYCTEDRICETRCNRGFIPKDIRNNIGVKSVRTCDEETNEWSTAPFAECVEFQTFCDFETGIDALRGDENAEVSVATVSGPTSVNPRVVGSAVINAECVPTHWVFTNTKECSVQVRCSCRYGNGTYFCLKNHESLDVGLCKEPEWIAQAQA